MLDETIDMGDNHPLCNNNTSRIVILDPPSSWWWTGGTLILYVVIGLIVGVIFLILKLRKKKPEELKIDPDDAEERAKWKLKYDTDNPDNFMREDRAIARVGQAGTERTPILWVMGKGSETLAKIDILVNLKNAKSEIVFLFNKKEDFVREAIRVLAENPEDQITEEKILGIDEMGRPTTTIKTKRMGIQEKKEIEEKKEAEESNAY
jgi:hypothetical protein